MASCGLVPMDTELLAKHLEDMLIGMDDKKE